MLKNFSQTLLHEVKSITRRSTKENIFFTQSIYFSFFFDRGRQ